MAEASTAAPIAVRPENICKTPRHEQICKLDAYYHSKQYDGRPDWWTGQTANKGVVPLRERKPCIIYPLPRAAVRQAVRFCYGEGRFPTIHVDAIDPEAGNVVDPLAVTEDEANVLHDAIRAVVDNGDLKPVARSHMANGLHSRTGVAIISLKRGRFFVELPHAKDCWAKFRNDDPSDEVEHLVWVYKFDKLVDDPQRGPKTVAHWFRRDVTDKSFVTFVDVPFEEGKPPVWQVDKSIDHKFGCCPVVWTRNLIESQASSDMDGCSLYEGLFEEFDALNFALSQRHRGIHFLGVPQPYETGVEDDDGPQAGARTATTQGYSKEGAEKHGAVSEPARRMSPDEIWSFRGKDVRLGFLETTGKAFEVASLHVNDVRGRLLETMSVVLVNVADVAQHQAGGQREMSAKFLELSYAPLLGLVDELRECWWPYGLQKMISICLRIIMARKGVGILIPNAAAVAKLLAKFLVPVADETGATRDEWMLPKMTPVWGDYFPPSNDEIKAGVETAAAAAGMLVTKKTAAAYVAPYFGVDDVDQEVEDLTKEADDEADKAVARIQDFGPPGNGAPGDKPALVDAAKSPKSKAKNE